MRFSCGTGVISRISIKATSGHDLGNDFWSTFEYVRGGKAKLGAILVDFDDL